MKSITDVLLGFCTAAVFIGVLDIMCPDGVMKKRVRYVLALIFLASGVMLFLSVGNIGKKLNIDVGASDTYYSAPADMQTEYLCAAVLKDAQIPYKKICAYTNMSKSGSIYISKIEIYTSHNAVDTQAVVRRAIDVENVEVINE